MNNGYGPGEILTGPVVVLGVIRGTHDSLHNARLARHKMWKTSEIAGFAVTISHLSVASSSAIVWDGKNQGPSRENSSVRIQPNAPTSRVL